MKQFYVLLLTFWLAPAAANPTQLVAAKNWIHGSPDCKSNQDPAIDVLEAGPGTYVLRQNKCINVEAPFIYVFFGEHTVFVQDVEDDWIVVEAFENDHWGVTGTVWAHRDLVVFEIADHS